MTLRYVLGATMMSTCCGTAWAQEPPPVDENQLGDIVVTAQRREESLQDVPIAVSALDTAAIERNSARDIRDLAAIVPNVTISEVNIGPSLAQISIRGVNSQDPERSFDPAVGVFIDGIYLGTSAFNLLDTFDLERIEVLRGPQGTLFGRNTTGGVINAFRTRPTMTFGVRGRAVLGSFDRRDFQAVVNAPIVEDQVGLKLYGAIEKDDGAWKNSTPGGPNGAKDRWRAGGAIRIQPHSSVDVVFSYDHAEDDSELTPYAPRGISTVSRLPVTITQTTFPVTPTTPIFAGFGPDLLCLRDPATGCLQTNTRRTFSNGPMFQNSKLDALTLNVDIDLTDALTLTGIYGWRKSSEMVFIDFDGTARTVFNARRDQNYEQGSGELRLTSNFEGSLNFVAGLFRFASSYDLAQVIKLDLAMTGAPVPLGTRYLNGSGDADEHSARTTAVFAQADFAITPTITLTAGGRYTWDRKRIFTTFFGAPFGQTDPYQITDPIPANRPITSQGGAREKWSQFTPKFAVNWKPSRDLLLYASYTKGYNAGGFSGRAGTVIDVTTPFDPEEIDAYEAGVKADLLDRRLRLNAAIFRNDYSNKQEEAIDVGPPPSFTSTTVRNVASARFQGAELEASVLLAEMFRIDASVGYLDAEYTDYIAFLSSSQYRSTPPQPAGTLIQGDFSDLKLRRAPKWTASLRPTLTADIGPGVFTLAATGRYVSVVYSEFFNDPRGRVPAQIMVDANAGFAFGGTDRDQFGIKLFVNNLTNKREFGSLTNSLVDFTGLPQPRRWGLELQARF